MESIRKYFQVVSNVVHKIWKPISTAPPKLNEMDELTDFETLIDLNEILPRVEENEEADKKSSQEPLSDVLDKMCETIDTESITMGLNTANSDEKPNENIALDDTILNLDEFNEILNETRVLNENINNLENEETVLSNNAKAEQGDNNSVPFHSPVANADVVQDTVAELDNDKRENENFSEKVDDTINLDEFEDFFNNTHIPNLKKEPVQNTAGEFDNDKRDIKNVSEKADDTIVDLDEFEDLFNNTHIPNLKKDTVQNTAGEFDNDKRKHENVSDKADDTTFDLDEFEEFINNMRIPNVNKDDLEKKETTLSGDAKNEVKSLNSVTDFIGIAYSATSEGFDNKVECKIDTDEANKKHNNKEDLDETIINCDEFQEVLNGTCAFKKTLLSKKLAELRENEDVATLDYCSAKLVKMEDQTKNTETNEMILNDFPVPPFTANLEEKENMTVFDLDISHNSNKDDKSELKTILIEEDTEVISISSTEDIIALDDSEDDGYNSDDFEFISESEAKKQGPLNLNIKELPEGKLSYSDRKYHKNNYIRCMVSARANRAPHVIPEGESYLDLFRGMCAPIVMNNLYYMTNKHVLPVKSMSISDGFGFDIPVEREESPEHVAEAAESLKRIRLLYPDENRKRRRRF